MSEKILNSRIVHKHDTEANWKKATNFIPKQGELIVYDIDDNYDYERFKIGDGATVVSALPFADDNKADVAHTHDSLKGGIINISAEQNLGGVRIYRDGGSTNGAFYLKPANNTYASNQSITIENGSNAVSNGAFLKFQGSSSDNVRIGGVKTPTDDNDAANKAYVDANKTVVDDALSDTSTNPVQNKVVNTAISNLNTLVGDTPVASQINTAISSKVEASDAITGLSVSGQTVTYTKGDGSTGTITTQDTQVNREPITTDADYPILLSRSSVNSTVDTTAVINSNIKANPSEGSIYVNRLEVYGTAKADGAYAGGLGSFANNIYSFAHGQNASASNTAAFSHGNSTKASGAYSHAEGDDTTASGTASHAEGYKTTASNHYSHAEGEQTTAGGSSSHAEGTGTTTSGEGAHAEGYYTIAQGNYSHVQGKYNVADSGNDYAHIVGNGASDDARANAHTLDWDGNAWFAGNIKVGGTGYNDSNAQLIATVAMLQNMLPKVTTITLGTNWVGTASPYYQDVALSCVTETSIVDLQPTPTQLAEWQDTGLAFTTQSGGGTVRVYVAGGKPTAEISVQVKVQEVVQV